jgi:hypothetical protein
VLLLLQLGLLPLLNLPQDLLSPLLLVPSLQVLSR